MKKLNKQIHSEDDLGFLLKGEGTAKTSLQRSAKGPVSIGECDLEGRFVELDNTGRKVNFIGSLLICFLISTSLF